MDNFDLKKYLAEGKLFEEDFKNPILDKYLELKKSIDYKTVFPTDLQSFIDSLDNTEREGLESDLAEGRMKDPSRSIKMGKYPQVSSDTPVPMNVKYLTTNGEKLTMKVQAKNRKEAVDAVKSKDSNFKAEIKIISCISIGNNCFLNSFDVYHNLFLD